MALNLFNPDLTRTFTYYDRCAIALVPLEMTAVRLQVRVVILATPLSRSLNFRYPYSKEFYGYGQSFFQNILVKDFPIEYTEQFVFDYWNQHATIAHQITDVLQRLRPYFQQLGLNVAALTLAEFLEFSQALTDAIEILTELVNCFTIDIDGDGDEGDGSDDFLNTFQMPVNLFRFKFAPGTVFQVTLDSWNLGESVSGSLPGNPITEQPYDTGNPNGNVPTPSGDRAPNGEPYGVEPPDSSPLDPELDPSDFSNAPEPEPEFGTVQLQGWSFPAVPQQQAAGRAIGCPAGNINASLNDSLNYINPTSTGVFNVRIDENGLASIEDIFASVPGFNPAADFIGASQCGVNGTRIFDA